MFPVRYELNFYINLLRNSVFKGSNVIHRHENPLQILVFILQIILYFHKWHKNNSQNVGRLFVGCADEDPFRYVGTPHRLKPFLHVSY
jgi:hypothetical protein